MKWMHACMVQVDDQGSKILVEICCNWLVYLGKHYSIVICKGVDPPKKNRQDVCVCVFHLSHWVQWVPTNLQPDTASTGFLHKKSIQKPIATNQRTNQGRISAPRGLFVAPLHNQ